MPNKDGKGPLGKGPKTGRQLGKCQGAEPQKNFEEECGKRPRRCRKFTNRE